MSRSGGTRLSEVALLVFAVLVIGFAGYLVIRDPAPTRAADYSPPTSSATLTETTCPPPEKVAVLGDSTRDAKAAGQALNNALVRDLPESTVKNFGSNGASLVAYRASPVLSEVGQFDPDAIELSIGINDLRLDQSAARVATFREDLGDYVAELHTQFPAATLHLSVPAALSTLDIRDNAYVTGSADAVTTSLRDAYLAVAAETPYVELLDVQKEVTGTQADSEDPPRYLSDQLHPNIETQAKIAGLIAEDLLTSC